MYISRPQADVRFCPFEGVGGRPSLGRRVGFIKSNALPSGDSGMCLEPPFPNKQSVTRARPA